MKCPLALSLRVTPIPSRTTQKSTRPRASDRPMCCQPGNRHGLSASEIDRRRHYSIKMHEMEARNTTQHVVSHTGAERQGNIFSFQSREKNVLDLSSYRPGVYTCNPTVTSEMGSRVENRRSNCSLPVVSRRGFRRVT